MRLIVGLLLFALVAVAQSTRTSDEFSTPSGILKITPVGHASLMLDGGGSVVQVDPVKAANYQGFPPADLILITHAHGDHLDAEAIAKVRQPATQILGPGAVAEKLPGVTAIANGETKTVGKWTIEAVPAYNIKRGPQPGRLYHEKGQGNGYLITYAGKRVYISGDSEGTPEMKALRNIDVAFVCINLPYTMPPEEATEAVLAFRPKIVYPYHYRGSDLAAFRKQLESAGIEVRISRWYD